MENAVYTTHFNITYSFSSFILRCGSLHVGVGDGIVPVS